MLKKVTALPLLLAVLANGCGAKKESSNADSQPLGENSPDLPTGVNGDKAAIGAFSEAEMNQKIAAGLAIWRKQRTDLNGIDKGACANCHSSDGFELALYDISDDDVRRRAHIDGVNEVDREALVEYFAALR
ncbi:MAG: hypothetical protein M3Q07_03865, partial [Pseudobdellovibrionaceae bacterium]|nr:hypothetical protein [Pseudobdellovibrionaceae bacterium]